MSSSLVIGSGGGGVKVIVICELSLFWVEIVGLYVKVFEKNVCV